MRLGLIVTGMVLLVIFVSTARVSHHSLGWDSDWAIDFESVVPHPGPMLVLSFG